ncbi:hypothetical protein EXU85_30790 [Spirosoma sp. KCTC 42546]|uniref:hypothetical protein n=1 Tax=Spirosoma sp. KCTC 42546 TaxID=2520506 RepID=UPI0011581538|nr:hypothetical protein [Spirosoma sp. KCTC 42546]QDK82759.1 hypothetical protein EXU85_30790 [Spirosoma sp. KCTC 42546]
MNNYQNPPIYMVDDDRDEHYWQMPLLTDYEVLRLLKRDSGFKSISIIIYSTSARSADINRCTDLGCMTFFIKPSRTIKNSERLLSSFFTSNLTDHEN